MNCCPLLSRAGQGQTQGCRSALHGIAFRELLSCFFLEAFLQMLADIVVCRAKVGICVVPLQELKFCCLFQA